MEKALLDRLEKIESLKKEIINLEKSLEKGIIIQVCDVEGYHASFKKDSSIFISANALFKKEFTDILRKKTKELLKIVSIDKDTEKLKCPHGCTFGIDTDKCNVCDICEVFEECYRLSCGFNKVKK